MRTAGAFLLALTFLPPNAWAGGGPPQFGNGGNDWVRRWIVHDHLGNAILYTDATAAVVHRRVFEPFGMIAAVETIPETEPTDRLFTGQRFEASAGVYNFRARWYDAETGRFLSVGPILQDVGDPQTHNAYGYVRNNPVNLVDPTGAGAALGAGFFIFMSLLASFIRISVFEWDSSGAAQQQQQAATDTNVAQLDILLEESVVLAQVNASPEGKGGTGNETASRADRVGSNDAESNPIAGALDEIANLEHLVFDKEQELRTIETQIEDQVARIYRLKLFAEFPRDAAQFYRLGGESAQRIDDLEAKGLKVADELQQLDRKLQNAKNRLGDLTSRPLEPSPSKNRALDFGNASQS